MEEEGRRVGERDSMRDGLKLPFLALKKLEGSNKLRNMGGL